MHAIPPRRSVLLGLLLCADAYAVRPFVTDDARISDVGQLEAEVWVDAMRDEHGTGPGLHGMVGASVTEWLQILAGTGVTWRASTGFAATEAVIQPKLLFLPAEADGRPGLSLVVGASVPLTSWRAHDARFGFFITAPVTTRLADDRLLLHLNLGARATLTPEGSLAARPFWGFGIDVFMGHLDWRYILEAYAGDPFEPDAPLVSGQTGFRWLTSDHVNLDLTFGAQPGAHRGAPPDIWAQLGVRVLFDAFNPRRRPGSPDGARGAFPWGPGAHEASSAPR